MSGILGCMNMLTKLIADGLILIIVLVALYMLLFRVDRRHWYRDYSYIVMAGMTTYVLAKFAGLWLQFEGLRPFEKLGVEAGALSLNNPGFPSDHAVFAMTLTLAVWFVTRSRKVTLALFIMTILMCVGRVLALVHTPLDVMGGMAIACIGALWYPPVRVRLAALVAQLMPKASQTHKKVVK